MDDVYTVGVAAELAGVSVRALHHYDQIGLVRPSRRSSAGYRLYTDGDLAEELRRHTDRWFHDCGYETHRGMAEHYHANRRSGRNYDEMAPGLSQYVYDAIIANCDVRA